MKYQPKTKRKLKKLIKDENIYLGDIDTSLIQDMSKLFYEIDRADYTGVEKWNVTNVTNMRGMFYGCKNFNQSLNNWNVSNVTNMGCMFVGCEEFNQPLNNWNVSNVTDMGCMFCGCEEFNQPLNNWNVSNVEDMAFMFCGCIKFNHSLSNWNLSNVIDMREMFEGCNKINTIEHPNHYKLSINLEVIDIIEIVTKNLQGVKAFIIGNVLKYIYRSNKKNGVEDLKKALFYLSQIKKDENKIILTDSESILVTKSLENLPVELNKCITQLLLDEISLAYETLNEYIGA